MITAVSECTCFVTSQWSLLMAIMYRFQCIIQWTSRCLKVSQSLILCWQLMFGVTIWLLDQPQCKYLTQIRSHKPWMEMCVQTQQYVEQELYSGFSSLISRVTPFILWHLVSMATLPQPVQREMKPNSGYLCSQKTRMMFGGSMNPPLPLGQTLHAFAGNVKYL